MEIEKFAMKQRVKDSYTANFSALIKEKGKACIGRYFIDGKIN